MKDYHINIFYSEEDGGYIADVPDLDSCSAFGKTPEQAPRPSAPLPTSNLSGGGLSPSFSCVVPVSFHLSHLSVITSIPSA